MPATPEVIADADITDASYTYLGNYRPVDETGIYRLARDSEDASQEAFVLVEEKDRDKALALKQFRAYFAPVAVEEEGEEGNPVAGKARRLVIGNEDGGTTGISPAITLPVAPQAEGDRPRKVMTPDGIRIVMPDGRVYFVNGQLASGNGELTIDN